MYCSTVVGQEVLQRRLEPWRWEAQCLAINSWPWPPERIIEADPLTTNYKRSCPRIQCRLFYGPFCIWSKLERWKSSISGSLMSWLQVKKIVILKCHLLLFCTWTISRSKCTEEQILYNNQLSAWTKKKLQNTSRSQTCTKKIHGHCLVVCCPSDSLKLSESWQSHYI